jgi:IclR-like helix-turn-helix domain-containing protein
LTPDLQALPLLFSYIENNVDIRNHTELCVEQSPSEPLKAFQDFGYRNRLNPVPSRKTTPPRREAMGGLAKGLAVIRAFSRDHAALSLSEVARSARIPAATARRCLLTLEELGYITRSGRDFLLRPKVLERGAAYLESMNIEQLTKNHLEELARNTSDSAALCVLDGVEIVYVARTSVRTWLRLEAHVGSRFPAHATSTGRVLLAGVSGERLQRYFENFMDQTGPLWSRGALVGKVGSVFCSTASQHGGQETTITSFHSTLLHHGMIIVGLPYTFKDLATMREITGGTPYGASCVTGAGSEARMPTKLELEMCRYQGEHVTRIASQLVAGARRQ